MVNFEPIKKKPGELIRSEDWNKIQEDIKADLIALREEIDTLKNYVNSLTESFILVNLESPTGNAYNLNEEIPGETGNYATTVAGYITKQWVLGLGKTGEICRFGVLSSFDILYYWSGAVNGDKKALSITLQYMDGTTYTTQDLYIHECTDLRLKGEDNPYVEYYLTPNERVWYKYALINPNPTKTVGEILFRDITEESAPRIGNAIQFRTKVKPIT